MTYRPNGASRRVSAQSWAPEYSGDDCTWRLYRSAFVYTKRRKVPA